MSKLQITHKTVGDFLKDKKGILIPDYQRPYSWEEEQLGQLWDDFVDFALPDDSDPSQFDRDSFYFLGTIVAFSDGGDREIVDGQQRLTSLILLLRAYYTILDRDAEGKEKWDYGDDQDKEGRTKYFLNLIAPCLWREKEKALGQFDKDAPKFRNDIATEADKLSVQGILHDGYAKSDDTSNYAFAFNFFIKKIKELNKVCPDCSLYLLRRILENVILLPIETKSQETALDLFSTINDRGMPLYDSDIFKTKIFNHYKKIGKFDGVVDRWKRMEQNCEVFNQKNKTSKVDELFKNYMHYSLAKNGVKGNHRDKMLEWYKDGPCNLLEQEETFEELECLSEFWLRANLFFAKGKKDLEQDTEFSNQDDLLQRLSDPVRRSLYVLSYSPYEAWKYILAAAYLRHIREKDWLSGSGAAELLEWVAAFLVGCSVREVPGRKVYDRLYEQIVNIVSNERKYERFRFDADELTVKFRGMRFMGMTQRQKKQHVAFLLAWWAFRFKDQRIPFDCAMWEVDQLEGDLETTTPESGVLWSLGNRVLLESEVKSKLSRRFLGFADKKSAYLGGYGRKGGTKNVELIKIAQGGVFGKKEIERRNDMILNSILDALRRTSQLEE